MSYYMSYYVIRYCGIVLHNIVLHNYRKKRELGNAKILFHPKGLNCQTRCCSQALKRRWCSFQNTPQIPPSPTSSFKHT